MVLYARLHHLTPPASLKSPVRKILSSIKRRLRPTVLKNRGYCLCCKSPTCFRAFDPWLRDHYLCDKCSSIPRERALMWTIEKFFPNWPGLVIHESSPSPRGASVRLRADCANYIGSQYFEGVAPGESFQGVRCENLEALSFKDGSIDLHVTQDVFEHIFDPEAAFREIARTLRPGGAHIFTTPLVEKERSTVRRASLIDGRVVHAHQPEYHGNPISTEGSLVTMHWGYDICDVIAKSSGLFTQIVHLDALELGIRAEYIEVLVTRKPTRAGV